MREPSRRTLFTERRGGILGFLSESVTAKVLIGMLIGVGSGLFLPDLLDYIREVSYAIMQDWSSVFLIVCSFVLLML